MPDITLYAGDTSDYIYVSPSTLAGAAMDVNWTCSACVIDRAGAKTIADFVITEQTGDGTEFVCYLTPTQTATLTVSGTYTDYNFVIQVVNTTTTPPYKKEAQYSLRVYEGNIA